MACPGMAHAQMLTGWGGASSAKPSAPPSETAIVTPDPVAPAPKMTPLKFQDGPKRADNSLNPDKNAPVDIEADNLSHDDQTKVITATGHVQLKQSGRVLKADKVVYDLSKDVASAEGHVVFNDVSGDVHFADSVTLSNQMKDGFVRGLTTYLAKGGKFTAKEGTRRDGTVITMLNAAYTSCDCAADADGNPPWQIRAKKVRYDETEHQVTYRNATVDVYGVPVAWTPYFSHPDGQIKRKSGFLSPTFGYNSDLGASVTNRYYWSMAPNRDATLGVMAMTNENPLLTGEYRQRFNNASLKIDGNGTSSSRTDKVGDIEVHKGDELRGNIAASGLWDMSDTWRSGVRVNAVSDDQFLRQYDLGGGDVLENEVYAERFSGRNYTVIRTMAFQDVRVDEDKTDQPNILPEVIATFEGEPNRTLGGRWDASLSALGLTRQGNGQDVNRVSASSGWQRRILTGFGDVTTVSANVRADAYRTGDRDLADFDTTRSSTSYATRLFPEAHAVTSYPLAKPMQSAQMVVAPEVSLTVSPNIDQNESNIPNEDSKDVQVDAANVFDANRFPGYDRVEDGVHGAYGVRTGIYGYGGSFGEVFAGQSYRFNNDNPFPRGSGLSDKSSNYVGEVNGLYDGWLGINYRFELANQNLSSQRHELDGYANGDRVQWNTRYFFAKPLEDTNIVENRQQLENNLTFKVASDWKLRVGALNDLGGSDPGLRRATVGADFVGCCVSMSLTANRNFTDESSGDAGTNIVFRMGLKGLGGYPEKK